MVLPSGWQEQLQLPVQWVAAMAWQGGGASMRNLQIADSSAACCVAVLARIVTVAVLAHLVVATPLVAKVHLLLPPEWPGQGSRPAGFPPVLG